MELTWLADWIWDAYAYLSTWHAASSGLERGIKENYSILSCLDSAELWFMEDSQFNALDLGEIPR